MYHSICTRAVILVSTCVSKGGVADVLRMSRDADLVERVDEGILTVGLERNVEVDREVGGWVTQALPVGQDGIPRAHRVHVFPT